MPVYVNCANVVTRSKVMFWCNRLKVIYYVAFDHCGCMLTVLVFTDQALNELSINYRHLWSCTWYPSVCFDKIPEIICHRIFWVVYLMLSYIVLGLLCTTYYLLLLCNQMAALLILCSLWGEVNGWNVWSCISDSLSVAESTNFSRRVIVELISCG